MEIVRISNTQVKFILTKTDLLEHNIKITELAYGSKKAQEFFKHMMEQAFVECSFEADNSPLMIEAIPTAIDSITIIVTKVSNPEQIEEKFNMIPRVNDTAKVKFKSKRPIMPAKAPENNDIVIYSFDCLDKAIDASIRINSIFIGDSMLFKHEESYFIYVVNNLTSENGSKMDLVDMIMGEYGQKHAVTAISKFYLQEHCEVMIENDAISKLALT
ncbi:MAG: adaptor protein MecA [Defluviitaleaceae bacterium]|nr:adaptor protein MecA [Defluviitaleaceae bacterium]